MTIEEAYAEPVAKRTRRDRAFRIGIVLGIVVGVVATLLLNRAADEESLDDDEPVVELEPAIIPSGTVRQGSAAMTGAVADAGGETR